MNLLQNKLLAKNKEFGKRKDFGNKTRNLVENKDFSKSKDVSIVVLMLRTHYISDKKTLVKQEIW